MKNYRKDELIELISKHTDKLAHIYLVNLHMGYHDETNIDILFADDSGNILDKYYWDHADEDFGDNNPVDVVNDVINGYTEIKAQWS